MPNFFIPCTWEQTGFYVIEAESLEAAQEIADDPDKWVDGLARLDALPPPHCELSNNEWAISHDDIREATPEEVATAEAPSYKEALAVALEALRGMVDTFIPEKMGAVQAGVHRDAVAAITTAEKALAV